MTICVRPERINLMGVAIDPLTMSQAVETVLAWTAKPGPCRYVVTPNVDHIVLLQHHEDLQAAYEGAELILADGAPVVWASHLLGRRLPDRIPGSDLTPAIFAAVPPDRILKTYLLGAMPGVAEVAAQNIERRWPQVKVTGCYSPPLGFEKSAEENDKILAQIAAAEPDLLIVGVGAPKQELWVHRHRERIAARAALCVGATIDFLAGEKRRAPVWMRGMGIEWMHRLATEPRRLASRYARDAWIFPQLVLKSYLNR
ncbi:Putative N-acetylmannosaminyltransferase [Anatilimnocola aggregata]|uniref:N-acetylmannosaminyltransferase n=1 Tax=Anatilimnocola aggregata TaxID=2528021 RepID=A0A517YCA5_9BACT|nr:WecB/TagA/CpsF family glycosyltransferase [Anatilimnocola aggregata]QDU27868.1 Putative N-acetylmannosaminyltransferase [Anatilimnocola aggregata]